MLRSPDGFEELASQMFGNDAPAVSSPPPAPRVSVGMPVYNSATWVEPAIESILKQTCQDFELVISDNASTDATYAICERFARADSRIRLLRNAQNIGANRNYMAVLRASRGQYFKWASSNDVCAPTFIEKCIAALEQDPTAVLACPRSYLFRDSRETAEPYDRDLELMAAEPAVRFLTMQNSMGLNNAVNGVIRRSALDKVSTMGSYRRADIVLMAELALLGKFLLLDERLFYRRMSEDAATQLKSDKEIERHLVPTARAPLRWQIWRYQFAVLRASRLVPFPSRDWLQIVNYALRTFIWSRRMLADEVLSGIRQGPGYT